MKKSDDKIREKESCIGHFASDELLSKVKKSLEEEKGLDFLIQIFKALGDSSRLKIMYVLSESPLCVCDIAEVLGMTQSLVSHHLKKLRSLKLVKFQRQGKQVIYSLDDDHVLDLMKQGLDHAGHVDYD